MYVCTRIKKSPLIYRTKIYCSAIDSQADKVDKQPTSAVWLFDMLLTKL